MMVYLRTLRRRSCVLFGIGRLSCHTLVFVFLSPLLLRLLALCTKLISDPFWLWDALFVKMPTMKF